MDTLFWWELWTFYPGGGCGHPILVGAVDTLSWWGLWTFYPGGGCGWRLLTLYGKKNWCADGAPPSLLQHSACPFLTESTLPLNSRLVPGGYISVPQFSFLIVLTLSTTPVKLKRLKNITNKQINKKMLLNRKIFKDRKNRGTDF